MRQLREVATSLNEPADEMEGKRPNAKLMDAAPEPSHSTGVTD